MYALVFGKDVDWSTETADDRVPSTTLEFEHEHDYERYWK
jgi:hypothetical protein